MKPGDGCGSIRAIDPVALQRLDLDEQGAALPVERQELLELRGLSALSEAGSDRVGVLSKEVEVEHGTLDEAGILASRRCYHRLTLWTSSVS